MVDAVIPMDHMDPSKVNIYRDRVDYVGSSKENNISILLWNITFEDAGVYTCFGKNPKEKSKNHSAIFTLYVVEECKYIAGTEERKHEYNNHDVFQCVIKSISVFNSQ